MLAKSQGRQSVPVDPWDPWDPSDPWGLRFAAEPEPAKPMNFKIKELTEEDWADWADNLRKVPCGICGNYLKTDGSFNGLKFRVEDPI